MIGIPHQLQRTAQQLRGGAPRGYAAAHSLAVDDVQGRSHVRPVGRSGRESPVPRSALFAVSAGVLTVVSKDLAGRGRHRTRPFSHSLRVRLSPPWRLERHPRAGLTLCSVRGVNSKPIYHVASKLTDRSKASHVTLLNRRSDTQELSDGEFEIEQEAFEYGASCG